MYRRNVPFSPVRTGRYDPKPILRALCNLVMVAAGLATCVVLIHGAFAQPEALMEAPGSLPALPDTVRPTEDEPELPPRERRFEIFTRGKDKKAFERFIHQHIITHGGEYRKHAGHTGSTREYAVPAEYLNLITPLKKAHHFSLITSPDEPAYWQWRRQQATGKPPEEPGEADTVIWVRVAQPAFEKWETVRLAAPLALTSAAALGTALYIGCAIWARQREEEARVRSAQDEYNAADGDDYDSEYY